MSLISKSQVIVLHTTKYGDSGAIIHVLDSLAGRQSLYLRGIKKSKNSTTISHFHNLNILDVITSTSEKSTLIYLREYSPIFTLSSIRTDVYKSSIALFISEVLYRSLKTENRDDALFRWLCESILTLDTINHNYANYHLWFLTGLCCKTGFRPNDNFNEERQIFDIISAQFIENPTDTTSNNTLFQKEESYILHKMLNCTLEEALTIELSRATRNFFSQKMLDYLSYHMGIQLNIKSMTVLHQIFS